LKNLMLIIIAICVATSSFAMENSLPNREEQAERYLETTPPAAMFQDMAEKVALNLPPEKRDEFKALLTKHIDINSLTKIMKDAMVNTFTADELSALADFYGSDLGKSSMAKFGLYMAEVMPGLQAEIIKAQAKANRELQNIEQKQ